jgi:hypothetical protein
MRMECATCFRTVNRRCRRAEVSRQHFVYISKERKKKNNKSELERATADHAKRSLTNRAQVNERAYRRAMQQYDESDKARGCRQRDARTKARCRKRIVLKLDKKRAELVAHLMEHRSRSAVVKFRFEKRRHEFQALVLDETLASSISSAISDGEKSCCGVGLIHATESNNS